MTLFKNEKTLETNQEDRQSSESNDEGLEVITTNDERHGPSGRELSFLHPDTFQLSRDILIQNGDTSVYWAEVSEFTRNKPDLTLHRQSREGPVVAATFFGTKKFRIGLGSDDISMNWIELKRSGMFMSKRYAFEWRGKPYELQRAKSQDTKATGLAKMMLTHFKIIDIDTGETIALYISKKFGKERGTVRLKAGLSEDLEILFVLAIASWRDKIRREQPKGGGGGG